MKKKTAELQSLFTRDSGKKLKVVLTGGPGVGKTSIVNQLKALRFDVKIEVFTEVFGQADRESKFEDFFKDVPKLLHDLVSFQSKLESSSPQGGISFYDRCMVDIISFAQQLGADFSEKDQQILDASHYDLVFIVEPLAEKHYVQNWIRRQTYKESLEHHTQVTNAYRDYCNKRSIDSKKHLVFVPDLKPDQRSSDLKDVSEEAVHLRTRFLLNHLIRFQKETHESSNQ